MSDNERNDVPSQIDWLARFTSKVGLGACICEGQEISAAIDEIERLTAERDELRRQLDPMGEFASADELIAALRAEKAEDEAMKRDAECWRELDKMMSDPDAKLNVNAGGWAVLKCGLLGKLGVNDV